MDISGLSSVVTALATSSPQNDAVSVSVQKKAMDLQASQAAQLIQSVTDSMPPSPSGGIDVYA